MTATTKNLPPAVPPYLLGRPALEQRLDVALTRRLTTLVAGAGFGKSTLLGAWTARVPSVWYTITQEDAAPASLARGILAALRLRVPNLPPDIAAGIEGSRGPDAHEEEVLRAQAFAALVCDALQERVTRDLVVVLDDAHEIGEARASAGLIEGLCRQAPPTIHLVLSSRFEPPFPIERLRGQGQVLELTGNELAFDVDEVAELLSASLDPEAAELAPLLHEGTGGWPAAVTLAIEALRGVAVGDRARAVEGVRRPGGRLFAYLAGEIFEREPAPARDLLSKVAPLPRFTPELCEALGAERANATLASLSRRGLFLEPQRADGDWFSLSSLARAFLLEYAPLDQAELRRLHRRGAAWFESNGQLEDALQTLAAIEDGKGIARLLSRHGLSLLRSGAVESVLRAADLIPPEHWDSDLDQLVGAARQIIGDWEGALACFERAAAGSDELSPDIAWRMGLIHHHRGRLDEALDVYGRGRIDGTQPRHEAMLLAWSASAHWLRADVESCEQNAERALEIATSVGDPQSLAAAHTVLAMLAALRGDRAANDGHYLRALDHAERAGDLLQIVRIHTNRSSLHVEEGAYDEALAEVEVALRLADLAGFAGFRALALTNRGEAKFRLGHLEEAVADLEAARSLYQRMGSQMVAYPLRRLGDIYRERGDSALARAAYEEAIAKAEAANDLQGLVPALAGLARVLAGEEPEEARALADRAVAAGPGMDYVTALLTRGHVALVLGDREQAAEAAADAAAAARRRRERAGLAEALELQALAAADPEQQTPRLEEAIAIWHDVRDPLGEARAQVALARVRGEAGRLLAELAARRLQELGARSQAARAAAFLAELDERPATPVTIQSLGRFRVLRDGRPVPLAEWQSKKARDLLRLLVARRGRPAPRESVIEALWPDEDPAKTANRLSVALSTIRSVLDPEKRFGPEHFVSADRSAIRLDVANVSVDVEMFLAQAAEGLALRRDGRAAEAAGPLVAAEAAYAGDFLEEDADESWAVGLREEARATYLAVVRALAEDAAASGDQDGAARYLLRILERDLYDEQAHLGLVSSLVAAGRHGEARRRFRAYCSRMEEIGVESTPFPSPAPG